MSIRSTAKAIIIKDGKILLNKCNDVKNGEYYSLPGGGQHKYETLTDAVIRECLEETGYTVNPIRFAALSEEICVNAGFREKYHDYAHKIYHVFICDLTNHEMKVPTEKDSLQESCEWIEIESLQDVRLLPNVIGNNVLSIISNSGPIFLGSEYIDFNHG